MEFDQVFNLVEGIVWITISIILLTRIRHFPEHKDILILGASAFFLFGLTDFVEIYTRSWHDPLWLLAWNGVCILVLLSCLVTYLRRQRRAQQGGALNEGHRAPRNNP